MSWLWSILYFTAMYRLPTARGIAEAEHLLLRTLEDRIFLSDETRSRGSHCEQRIRAGEDMDLTGLYKPNRRAKM